MTAPSSTKEFDEAVDAGFSVAIRIKQALAPGGPGGKKVTLDELLHAVSDGDMKRSIRNLVEAVEALIQRQPLDIFELIPTIVEAVLDFLHTLRDALKDRKMDPGEILAGVSTAGLRPELQRAIDGIDKIPGELTGLDMWRLMGIFQRIAGRLPELLAPIR